MRLLIVIGFLIFLMAGCKKKIEKIKENAVISAMTDGQWIVTSFVKNGSNITLDFSNYKFQFFSNYTVDAIQNGNIEKTGTWNGDAATMTIESNFPNAILPLSLINGIWHIDNNSWTFVVASQKTGDEKTMKLEKQ